MIGGGYSAAGAVKKAASTALAPRPVPRYTGTETIGLPACP